MSTLSKNPRRLEGDPVGDQLFELFRNDRELLSKFRKINTNAELKGFLKFHAVVGEMLPDYTFVNRMENQTLHKGQQFFQKHVQDILTMLGFYSLPYCYLGANGARVLAESRKIMEDSSRRLVETAEFVFDACTVNGLNDEGKAFVSILNVRLMHAAARFYTKSKIKDEVPVNQDDMLGTLMAFSLIVVRGLRKIGVDLKDDEVNAYMMLWNFIGEKLGIRKEYLPDSIRQASFLDKEIRQREFRYSQEGCALVQSLITSLSKNGPEFPLIQPIDLICYFLEDNAQLLGIQPTSGFSVPMVKSLLRSRQFFGQLSGNSFDGIRKDLKKQLSVLNAELRF